MCLETLLHIADLYYKINGINIITNRPQLSCNTGCNELDTLLYRFIKEGFNIGISGNMCEFLGSQYIEDIQYQFYDINNNKNGDYIAFIIQQDFNIIAINKNNLKIYCSIQGDDFILVADNMDCILNLIEYMLEHQINCSGSDFEGLNVFKNYINDNKGYYNKDYLIDYFYG